jgi:hypothetical protein
MNPHLTSIRNSISPGFPFLAVGFFAAFVWQINTSITVDAYELRASRRELMGFVAMAAFMAPYLFMNRFWESLKPVAVTFTGLFLIHLFAILLSSGLPVVPPFISRHGLVCWIVVGGMARIAVEELVRFARATPTPLLAFALGTLAALTPLIPALSLNQYALEVRSIIGYQSIAGLAITLILTCLILLQGLLQNEQLARNRPIAALLMGSFFLSSLLLTYYVALTQSTAIVAVWLAATAAWLFPNMRLSSITSTVILLGSIALIWYLTADFIVGDLKTKTRFRQVLEGEWVISSIQHRFQLLSVFWEQWMVSPIFGDYKSDSKTFGKGLYVHSLPLSLLTHTGLIGFSLFGICLFDLFRGRKFTLRNPPLDLACFIISLLFASVATFFTWSPLWFFIGYFLPTAKVSPIMQPARQFSSRGRPLALSQPKSLRVRHPNQP